MGIGNAILFEPALHALRAYFGSAAITVVLDRTAPSRAVFEWVDAVDEIIENKPRPRKSELWQGLRLAARRWDIGVVRFNGLTRGLALAAVLGRIKYRVGHVSSGRYRQDLDWIFNVPVAMCDHDHEVDRYLALAERLGCPVTRRVPILPLRLAAAEFGQRYVAALRAGGAAGPLVAIQPGTSALQRWKRWPVEHWRELIARLSASGFGVIALGSSDERDLLESVCRGSTATNAAGIGSLEQTAGILALCQALVCTDSGLMHLAAAVGRPVVAIFGPTDRTRTTPVGPLHRVLTPPRCHPSTPCLNPNGELSPSCTPEVCLRSIEPGTVVDVVADVVGRPLSVLPGRTS